MYETLYIEYKTVMLPGIMLLGVLYGPLISVSLNVRDCLLDPT
jgi:hypothetical protein